MTVDLPGCGVMLARGAPTDWHEIEDSAGMFSQWIWYPGARVVYLRNDRVVAIEVR